MTSKLREISIGGVLLFVFQSFMLALAAFGIGAQSIMLAENGTRAAHLTALHQGIRGAEWLLILAALLAWLAAEASLIRRLWRGEPKSTNPFGEFAPIMFFLMLAIAALLVGGAGLLAAGIAHTLLSEDASYIVGGVVVAAVICWAMVTVRQPTKPASKP